MPAGLRTGSSWWTDTAVRQCGKPGGFGDTRFRTEPRDPGEQGLVARRRYGRFVMQGRLHVDQPAAQIIGAFQDDVDARGVDRPLGISGTVQYGFHFVGEFLDLPQFQKAGKPLDGMEATEDCVQGLAIGGLAFQGEYLGFDVDQVLPAFDDKIRNQFRVLAPSDVSCVGIAWAGASRAFWRFATPSCSTEETVKGSSEGTCGQSPKSIPEHSGGADHRFGMLTGRSSRDLLQHGQPRGRVALFSGSPTTSWRAMSSICCRNSPG